VKTLIIATGPHSRPRTPSFPGMDSFEGTILHSAQWDASVDLKGKRVAVIGTGASAIQIVPNIAPEVAEVRVFQRSPAWIVPRGERKISRLERGLFRAFPLLQHLERQRVYWFMELVGLAFQGNPLLSRVLKSMALKKLKKEVRDPELRRRLTPTYRIGCKRLLLSDDFYPALNRDRVHLITEAIAEIVPKGVVTGDGKTHEVDHIVMATGFTVADGDGFMPVIGRNGRILSEEWNTEGAQAYLGINISGYPNMAFLLGPNSGLSHSSALHVMESQLGYVLRYLAEIDRLGEDASLDVDPEAQRVYNEGIQAGLVGTVWNSGCSSWYLNRHGRNVTVFPGITAKYRRVTARFDPAVYRRLQPVAADSAQELHLPSLRH
jgi:cation diffusion facilitator CzcD-associated flavoprotein CzcO